jgi:iron complex transport system substrate-binding protein
MKSHRYITPVMIVAALFLCPLPALCKTFKDAMGTEVRLRRDPVRIIPLAPSLTEILYYLGLGDRVAGVTTFSYYPPEAKEKPGVGSYMNLNVESIISLSPDLVIATKDGNSKEDVELLREAGIQVYVVDPRNVIEAVSTIEEIGNICGVSEKARQLVEELKRRLDYIESVARAGKRPLVFLQINLKPIMTVNKNTFHNDLIRLAGGINMTADEPVTYPRISIEEVISKRPDVIIISSMERGGEFEKAREEWMKWKSIPAVKNNRVYLIDPDLIDRPSQRIIDGLEEMARLIHSEIDWNKAKDKND